MRGTSTRQPNSGLVSNQDSVLRRSTTSPTTTTAGGAICAVRASAAIRSRVETTVTCSVVVPTLVIATGVVAARPAATSAREMSPMPFTADSSTSVRSSAYCVQSTFASPQVTTATSRLFFVVSGTPAYAGTAVTDETPGTISKPTPALTHACASSGPEAYTNGSPAISRTTRHPDLACFTTTFARPAWVSGWPSWPKPPSTTSACGQIDDTRSACAGTSVTTTSACRSSSTARTVSRSGSPGPLPTNDTKPLVRADGTGGSGTEAVLTCRVVLLFGAVFFAGAAVRLVTVLLTVAFLLVVVGCGTARSGSGRAVLLVVASPSGGVLRRALTGHAPR